MSGKMSAAAKPFVPAMSANAKPFVPKSKYNPNAKPYIPAPAGAPGFETGKVYPNLPNVVNTNTPLNKPFDPATNVSNFAKKNPEVWKSEVARGIQRSPLPNLKKGLMNLPNLTAPLGEPWTSMGGLTSATAEGGRKRRGSTHRRRTVRRRKVSRRRSGAARRN